MILIPEIETVVLLVPRAGSSSIRKAVAEKYPRSMLLYRHMEADGIPDGYCHWSKVGVVRDPLDRLWSCYKFLRAFGLHGRFDYEYAKRLRESVLRPFGEWITDNQIPFTSPYGIDGRMRWPKYSVRHHLPENVKSQWLTLRPDLGTEIIPFHHLDVLEARLGIRLGRENQTNDAAPPVLRKSQGDYMRRVFAWDYAAVDGHVRTRP